MSKRIQPKLEEQIHAKLEAEARSNGAKISPYAASILTKHVAKQDGKRVSKNEKDAN